MTRPRFGTPGARRRAPGTTLAHRRAGAEAGFSLLEMLVAMVLLGLVGVMAADGIRFGLAAWERGAEAGARATEMRQTARFLRRVMAGAVAVPLRTGARVPPLFLEGAPQRVALIAPLPVALAPPGRRLIEIAVEPDATPGGSGRSTAETIAEDRATATVRLVLRTAPLGRAGPAMPPDAPGEILLDGLEGARFAFFDPGDPEAGRLPGWVADWPPRSVLPEAVALTLERDGRRLRLVAPLGPARGAEGG